MSNAIIIDCTKLDTCPKVDMVLDKDIPDWVIAQFISSVCIQCKERMPEGGKK